MARVSVEFAVECSSANTYAHTPHSGRRRAQSKLPASQLIVHERERRERGERERERKQERTIVWPWCTKEQLKTDDWRKKEGNDYSSLYCVE